MLRVLKHMDNEDQGYFDFKKFAKVVHPNMSDSLVIREEDRRFNPIPNRAMAQLGRDRIEAMTKKHIENRDKLKGDPELRVDKYTGTRFGSKPLHQDTFIHYKPMPQSPGFVEEKDRLVRKVDNNVAVTFQG